jgi:hypothetical protein
MILSNYWKWLDGVLKTDSWTDAYYDPAENLGLVDMDGINVPITIQSSEHSNAWYSRNINNATIAFGSGNGSITADDYEMDTDVTSDLSNINFTENSVGSNEGLTRTYAITGTNSGSSNVTITEVGLVKHIKYYDRNDGYQEKDVLFEKVKLATALTVAPNENFIINLAWNEV